jgi:hypothetical protein
MTRRSFIPAAAAAASAGSAAAAGAPQNVIIELRRIQLRNGPDNQRQRTSDFLEKHALAAYQRAGAGPVGVFASSIAPGTPFLLTLVAYPSLAAMEQIRAKMSADSAFQKALDTYNSQPGLNYVRIDSSLLRTFDGFPTVVPPPDAGKRPSRLFEVRMYESNNLTTLHRKIKMFNEGEAAIFKRLGMQPVFFGETLIGQNQPNLVYMLSYQDLADRDKAWRAFGGDAEWKKLRETPGYSDAEIVSNITNYLVSPLPFSPIR